MSQIGYSKVVVHFLSQKSKHYQIKFQPVGCSDGIMIYSEGEAEKANGEIEEFLMERYDEFSNMNSDEFEELVQNTIKRERV